MKRLLFLGLVLGLAGVAGVVAAPLATAETHSNCIQFDSSGNVIGLTPNCTQTISQQGGTPMSFAGANPCTGDAGTVTLLFTHQVYHINVNGASDAWDTGTSNGTASFVPDDSSKPSGQGTWTNWFGDSFNAQNFVQHFTMNFDIHLSNGQTATFHQNGHVSFTPNGPAVSFDKTSATCS